MKTTPIFAAQSIKAKRPDLAMLITQLQFVAHPELERKYGSVGKEKCTEDALFHLNYLAEAIAAESQEIFSSYLQWALVMLQSRNIPQHDLLNNLQFMKEACSRMLPADVQEVVNDFIDNGIKDLKKVKTPASYLVDTNPLLAEARQYLQHLLEGKRKEALLLIIGLINKDRPIGEIFEFIFETTQQEVGLLWQTNKITVAHEHFCTAATQQIMSTLYTYIFNADRKDLRMVACSVSGDLHEVGIRMLSDFFEMNGWQTYYAGASLPDAAVIAAIKEQKADLLAISVTMSLHLGKAREMIANVRKDESLKKVKIIVGGYPFNLVPLLWKKIGADGCAVNGREAVQLANRLIAQN